MAGSDAAELAFLQSMQNDPTSGYSNGYSDKQPPPVADDDDDEEYDPSSLMPDTEYAPQQARAVSPQARTPNTQALKTEPGAGAPKQPRTVRGGFVVDDEDDEEDLPMLKPKPAVGSHGNVTLGRASSHTPQRSLSQTPSTIQPDVSIHKAAQDQGFSGIDSTGVTRAASTVSNVPAASRDAGVSLTSDKTVKPSPNAIGAPNPSNMNLAALAQANTEARLPSDRIGQLEDRIAEDRRADIDAWLSLISEYRKRNGVDKAREAYERFFEVFPNAAEHWVMLIQMELDIDDQRKAQMHLANSLTNNPNVQLWSLYINIVRRANNLVVDQSNEAQRTLFAAWDFLLNNVGIDKDAGKLWLEYIETLESFPGRVGGTTYLDQQKADMLRKAYRKAIVVPTQSVNALWIKYKTFEETAHRNASNTRQMVQQCMQQASPGFVTAKTSYTALENMTKDLVRTTLPRLPPVPGFDGDVGYTKQIEIWNKWIEWEKSDPLLLKDEDPKAWKDRILYVFKQALMALRFWPQMWYQAAEFCFENSLEESGDKFLKDGLEANPESCLLAFKRADRIEASTANEKGDVDAINRRAEAVRAPYNKVLDALYGLVNKAKAREKRETALAKAAFEQTISQEQEVDDDDDEGVDRAVRREQQLQERLEPIVKGIAAEINLLKQIISHTWIALMRAMRRIQGQGAGKIGGGGHRGIFFEARKRGQLTSMVYIANALIEHRVYRDQAASKIFDRGMKLFPDDEVFALAYIKHLISIGDSTNARAVFESTISRLTSKPETVAKTKPLFQYFHEYESQFGELDHVIKLEKRMASLFPNESSLSRFSHRYVAEAFDPTAARPLISPIQMTPKSLSVPSVEQPPPSVHNSPRPPIAALAPVRNSPKRPFIQEESDTEALPPRKIPRGESPLKGAAGGLQRRLMRAAAAPDHTATPPPPSIPGALMFLLGIIPGAETYDATRLNPDGIVRLLRRIDPHAAKASQPVPQPTSYGHMQGSYGYGR